MTCMEPPSRPNLIQAAKLPFCCALLLLAWPLLSASLAQGQSPAPAGWLLSWSDEFYGPDGSVPDPAKWAFEVGGSGFGNKELETYTSRPVNAAQRGGNLVITARKEDLAGPDGVARQYTSARIRTQGHFAQAYGRFEARMKLPAAKGIWPAFWLLGNDIDTLGWPKCGEIDIMENVGESSVVYSTLHGPGYSGGSALSAKFPLRSGEAVDTGFHVYAVEWSPETIRFFFDNRLIAERTPANLPTGTRWVYDHPFFVILNLAVGGVWPGNPDATTTFPQQMLVDYVRVYRRAGAPASEQP